MPSTSMNIRMDSEVKKQAEDLFSKLGINMTTAINIFLRQSIREHGIPFELKVDVPNNETVAAISEGEKIIKNGTSRFESADDMFKDLGR